MQYIYSRHNPFSTIQFESTSLVSSTNTAHYRRWDLIHSEFGNPFSVLCICFLYHSVNLISMFHSTWPNTTWRWNFDFFIFQLHNHLVIAFTHNTSVVRILFHNLQQDSYRKRRHSFTPCDFQTNKTIN